jgi:hypothetical protein
MRLNSRPVFQMAGRMDGYQTASEIGQGALNAVASRTNVGDDQCHERYVATGMIARRTAAVRDPA